VSDPTRMNLRTPIPLLGIPSSPYFPGEVSLSSVVDILDILGPDAQRHGFKTPKHDGGHPRSLSQPVNAVASCCVLVPTIAAHATGTDYFCAFWTLVIACVGGL
jgi:hypothetical protein